MNYLKNNQDKVKHFFACAILTLIISTYVNPFIAGFIVLVIGIAKEVLDVYKPNPTGFNIPDLIADILGIIVGLIGGILWL